LLDTASLLASIAPDTKPANSLAFLPVACGLIAFRSAGLFGEAERRSLYWLDVQPSPDDLVRLNPLQGHSPYPVLLPIGLPPMKVQFGPDGVSFCHLAQDLDLDIWNRREEETPVFAHPSLSDKVSFRVERLLTAKVRSETGHHRLQIVLIRSLYHALEHQPGGRMRLRILSLFL
jgi:hypothetical protein